MASGAFLTPRRAAGLVAAIILPTLVWFSPAPEGLPLQGQKALAITILGVILWISELIRPEMTGLLTMLLFTALGIAPPEESFGGFLTSSVWLAFSGFVIGAGVLKSGLARRLAESTTRLLGGTYRSSVLGVAMVGVLLSFVMPAAIARVTILIPIAMMMGRVLGYAPYSKGMAGLTLAATLSTSYAGLAVLTGGLPSITLLGLAESLLGLQIPWSEYLLLMFPTFGLLTVLILIAGILILFKPEPATGPVAKDSDRKKTSVPLSPAETRMLIYLGAAILLWSTDSLHGVRAAWIGLLIALLVTLPRIGVFEATEISSSVNFPTLFFVAAAIALGNVAEYTGFAGWATGLIFQQFTLGQLDPLSRGYAIVLLVSAGQLFATGLGSVAILTPVLVTEAVRSGLDPVGLLLIQVGGVNMAFLPYEMLPIAVAYGYNVFTNSQAIRIMVFMSIATLLLIIPSTVAYWMLLGVWS